MGFVCMIADEVTSPVLIGMGGGGGGVVGFGVFVGEGVE